MSFPKLKNPLLCRITIYLAILGCFFAAILAIIFSPMNEMIKTLIAIALMVCMIIYLVRNFLLLVTLDAGLALLQCNKTARKHFPLPADFSAKSVEKRLLRFGKEQETMVLPRPAILRFESRPSYTIFAKGIEKTIALFYAERMNEREYRTILQSAKSAAYTLGGQKKYRFLDKDQRSAPINRAIIILIVAKSIDEHFRKGLWERLSSHGGDGMDEAILPCILDLERNRCLFDSLRLPYLGLQYPMKNRGIRLIRKILFKDRLPFAASSAHLDPIEGLDINQSLWAFWRENKMELKKEDQKAQNRFKRMAHQEIHLGEDALYLKWKEQGLALPIEREDETKKITIELIPFWDYPRSQNISKAKLQELKTLITAHLASLGYTAEWISFEE